MEQCLSIVYPLSSEEQDNQEMENFRNSTGVAFMLYLSQYAVPFLKEKTEGSITAKNLLLSNDGEYTIIWVPSWETFPERLDLKQVNKQTSMDSKTK